MNTLILFLLNILFFINCLDKESVKRKSRIKLASISGEDESDGDIKFKDYGLFNHSKENGEASLSNKELDSKHSKKAKKLVKKRSLEQISDDENSCE